MRVPARAAFSGSFWPPQMTYGGAEGWACQAQSTDDERLDGKLGAGLVG
jgi:hypothetical protein